MTMELAMTITVAVMMTTEVVETMITGVVTSEEVMTTDKQDLDKNFKKKEESLCFLIR